MNEDDDFPARDSTAYCLGCDQNFKKIKNLEAENKRLKEAVGLLNSMVLSGERHSATSREVVERALKGE